MGVLSFLFHDVFVGGPHESGFQSPAADRYKLPIADFDAQLDGIASVDPACPFVITVDDGGLSYYTLIADRLEAHAWRGYCFVPTDAIGRRGFLDRAQIRELDARGHVIGSHSATHPPRLSACASDGDLPELGRTLGMAMRSALAVVVPFALLLPLVALDLSHVIWGWGAGAGSYDLFAPSLALFGVGLVFFTVHYLVLRGFYALERRHLCVPVGEGFVVHDVVREFAARLGKLGPETHARAARALGAK